MKELLPAIGQLVVLKRINRPLLEAQLEICRPNLAASFHGNRTFPEKKLPTLRAALLLDNDYRFDPDHVQALWPRVGKYTPEEVLAVIKVFAVMPLTAKYRVNVIGELGTEAVALVVVDNRDTLIILQHDKPTFLKKFESIISVNIEMNIPSIEIHTNIFHNITTDQTTPNQVINLLDNPTYVWTWQRIRKIALEKGITPDEAAKILKISVKGGEY